MNTSSKRSYDRYSELFNKACSSVLFLIIALLTSALCVGNIINVFDAISTGNAITICITVLPALFITLTTIGLWILFINAKKNSVNGSTFGLVKSYPKFEQVIKIITFILVIIAIVAIIIGLFTLKLKIDEAIKETGGSLEELKDQMHVSFGGVEIPKEYVDIFNQTIEKFIDRYDYYLTTGITIATVIGVVTIIFIILELIRCSMLVKLISSAGKMFKTGHMQAPPSIFFCVLNFIFGAINIFASFAAITFNIFDFSWEMCLPGVTGVILVLIGIIVMINVRELKKIYSEWQTEIGMVSADAAAANGTK